MAKKKVGRPKDSRKTYPRKTDAQKAAKRKGQPKSDVYKVKGGHRVKKPRKKSKKKKR